MINPPIDPIAIPEPVRIIGRGSRLSWVWTNQAGGLTFESVNGRDRRFIKWAPRDSGTELGAEVTRLRWAGAHARVPVVLDHGQGPEESWLVTRALPGRSAVSQCWREAPALAVVAIGEGLRTFHDSLPVPGCPFTWSAAERLEEARRRRDQGHLNPATWHPEHRSMTPELALRELSAIPPIDEPVVCHGDACAPNTLLADDGRVAGQVDLGRLGVGDRWADLAIATWSATWNYGPGWEERLLGAYGVAPDPERTRYYRLLWDLGP